MTLKTEATLFVDVSVADISIGDVKVTNIRVVRDVKSETTLFVDISVADIKVVTLTPSLQHDPIWVMPIFRPFRGLKLKLLVKS